MEAFQELYKRYYPDVFRFALFLTGDPTFGTGWRTTGAGHLRGYEANAAVDSVCGTSRGTSNGPGAVGKMVQVPGPLATS